MENKWPKSIDDSALCDTQEYKNHKARTIIEFLIEEDLTDKKLLDFGCGEGFCSNYASQYTNLSVGYDLKIKNWMFKQSNSLILTNDFEEARKHAPYDVILIFDVINHVSNPDSLIKDLITLCNRKTNIYLRTHPWQSRHANHDSSNRAYIHLVEGSDSQGVFHNKKTIDSDYFKSFEFKVIKERFVREEIESFFSHIKFIEKPDSTQFVDYVLKKEPMRFL